MPGNLNCNWIAYGSGFGPPMAKLLLIITCLVLLHVRRCQPVAHDRLLCKLQGRATCYGYEQTDLIPGDLDDQLVTGLQVIGRSGNPPLSVECLDILTHLLCTQASPPCNPDSELLMLICEDDCRLFNQVKERGFCSEIDTRLEELSVFSNDLSFKNLFSKYNNLNCSDPATYYDVNITTFDPDICTGLFSPEVKSK